MMGQHYRRIGPRARGYECSDGGDRSLPPPQRAVFLLKAEADLSLEEIAAATGAGIEATKSRMRYAVARLRAQLATWERQETRST